MYDGLHVCMYGYKRIYIMYDEEINFRIKLVKDFIDSEETMWMFEQLKSEIPWEEKEITVWGEYVELVF